MDNHGIYVEYDYQQQIYSLGLQEVVYVLSMVMVKSFSICGTKCKHEVFRLLARVDSQGMLSMTPLRNVYPWTTRISLSMVMVKSFSICGTKFSQLCLQHEVFRDLDKGQRKMGFRHF